MGESESKGGRGFSKPGAIAVFVEPGQRLCVPLAGQRLREATDEQKREAGIYRD